MTKPAVPILGDVLGPAIDAMIVERPTIQPHLDSGRYGNVLAGWRGQFDLARARLTAEHIACRRTTAEKQALTEVCSSEYGVPREDARAALGEVSLVRTVVHAIKDVGVTADDADDEASTFALCTAITTWGNTHRLSVYSSSTGVGSHDNHDTEAWPFTVGASYLTLCLVINLARGHFNNHLANTASHWDADTTNTVSMEAADLAVPALIDGGSDVYADATAISKVTVHRALNTLKAAINKHAALESRAGVIRKGHRFEVRANAAAVPPIEAAQFVVTRDTFVATAQQTVAPRIEASQTGSAANQPRWTTQPEKVVASLDTLYDASATLRFAPVSLGAAGGHPGQADPELARAAGAMWTGRHGPTAGALIAGALLEHGAARVVVRDDTTTGTALVYAVDVAWSQSDEWEADIANALSDPEAGFLGFGCRLSMERVENQLTRIEATIMLRDAQYLLDTSKIAERVQRALRKHLDDRKSWFVWTVETLRAVVTKADRRILACPTLAVFDAATNLPIAEPAIGAPAVGQTLVHYYLADNAVAPTFTAPS